MLHIVQPFRLFCRARNIRVWPSLARWRRNARTRSRLADLPPHILRDIGRDPAEARRKAARPFWDG